MPARGDEVHDRSGGGVAADAERARTPRTPFVALAGVGITLAIVVAMLVALALTLYFVYR